MRLYMSLLCVTLVLSGCVSYAPDGIRGARIDFNQDVHETNDQQLLLNVVRVRNGEAPVFTNIVERDFQATSSGGLGGGATSIGAIPVLGMLSGTASLTQAPTDKILLPYGIDLINQYDSPITLASFNNIYQSNYYLDPVLVFTFQNLTPDLGDNILAFDLIRGLDSFGAVGFANYGDNKLAIYRRDAKAVSVKDAGGEVCFGVGSLKSNIDRYWGRLAPLFHVSPKADRIIIEIPEKDSNKVSQNADRKASRGAADNSDVEKRDFSRIVTTRTAIGALREVQQYKEVYFLPTEAASAFISKNITAFSQFFNEQPGFYYVPKPDVYADPVEVSSSPEGSQSIEQLWGEDCESKRDNHFSAGPINDLGGRRAFILIEHGVQSDPDAYVSVFYHGEYYSIRNDDRISKNNLFLLSTILTVEAKPSANAPTQTVLSPSVH